MPPAENWREMAMYEALRTRDTRTAQLLREVWLNASRSPRATTLLGCSRSNLLNFLKKCCTARSLLSGTYDWHDEEANTSGCYLDWYEVVWQNHKVELIFLPNIRRDDAVLCMADTQEVLRGFVVAALDYIKKPFGRVLRYSGCWEDAPELGEEINKITWNDVILPASTKQALSETFEGFMKNRSVYSTLGFAWRRGVLLVGPPGTGKTMVCKAAATALSDLPFLYVRDLSSDSGDDAITTIFRQARKLAPCLLVFEDLDGLVGAYNRTEFLNELDGFKNNEVLLVIASSNHPERIDEALLKRPSRFDRVFHIGLPLQAERREYCRRLLFTSSVSANIDPQLDREKLADDMAAKTDGFTPAYLKETFTGAALQCAHNGEGKLNEQFVEALFSQIAELRTHLKRSKNAAKLGEMDLDDRVGFRPRGTRLGS